MGCWMLFTPSLNCNEAAWQVIAASAVCNSAWGSHGTHSARTPGKQRRPPAMVSGELTVTGTGRYPGGGPKAAVAPVAKDLLWRCHAQSQIEAWTSAGRRVK